MAKLLKINAACLLSKYRHSDMKDCLELLRDSFRKPLTIYLLDRGQCEKVLGSLPCNDRKLLCGIVKVLTLRF
jgi:hypothetical protein